MSAADIIAEAAEVLDRIRPELAARLREIQIGRPKGKGPSAYNLRLAELWISVKDRIQKGEDEAEVLAEVQETYGWDDTQIANFWMLEGRPKLRRILKDRGAL